MTKSTKRKIVTIAMVICVFALAAAGTLAYFADKTEVATNTFTIGNVRIRLSEAVVNENGKTTDDKATDDIWDKTGKTLRETRTYKGNTEIVYGNDGKTKYGYALVPGKEVDKDPIVTVLANSEPCYVRTIVTLNNAQNFITVYQKHQKEATVQDAINAMAASYFKGYEDDVWVFETANKVEDTVVVSFRYVGNDEQNPGVVKKAAANTDLPALITAVKLPEWVDSADAALFEEEGFKVEIYAEAIQAEGFEDANEAWDHFDEELAPTIVPASSGETTDPTNP